MNLQEAAEKVNHLGDILNFVFCIDKDNLQIKSYTFRGIQQKCSESRFITEVIMGDFPHIIIMPMEEVFATREHAAEVLNPIISKKIESLKSKIIPTGTK